MWAESGSDGGLLPQVERMASSADSATDYVVVFEELPRYDRPRALPPPPSIPRGTLDRLENQLREAIFTRSSSRCNEHSVVRAAFRAIDRDGSGMIDVEEVRGVHPQANTLPHPRARLQQIPPVSCAPPTNQHTPTPEWHMLESNCTHVRSYVRHRHSLPQRSNALGCMFQPRASRALAASRQLRSRRSSTDSTRTSLASSRSTSLRTGSLSSQTATSLRGPGGCKSPSWYPLGRGLPRLSANEFAGGKLVQGTELGYRHCSPTRSQESAMWGMLMGIVSPSPYRTCVCDLAQSKQ